MSNLFLEDTDFFISIIENVETTEEVLTFEYITFQYYFMSLFGNIIIPFYRYRFVAYFRILTHKHVFLCIRIKKM